MAIYEVKSSIAQVMEEASDISKTLGILNSGDKIDSIGIIDDYAFFKYNDKNGYVKLSNLIESYCACGTVTVQFLDAATSEKLINDKVYNNVSLGKHTYYAEMIYEYNPSGNSYQDVFLTEDNDYKTITFLYNKITKLGSVKIKYIDYDSLDDIEECKVIENLQLGSYVYTALSIAGYEVDGDSEQTITLSDDDANKTLYFRYKKIIGKVNVRFIDTDTLEDIAPEECVDNLPLGINTIFALDIEMYRLMTISPQIINLTDNNNEETIFFRYKNLKNLGTVTIRYINSATSEDIINMSVITDLTLGTYTYKSIHIAGYKVIGSDSYDVTLTMDNPNQTINFKYNEVVGSVKTKFIDADNYLEIKEADISSGLSLGMHSFNAVDIEGYEISGASVQVIMLTDTSPDEEIYFYYKKVAKLGSITLRYIDKSDSSEITDPEVISGLNMGEHSYSAPSIAGYNAIDNDSKTVMLDEDNPDAEIKFFYDNITATVNIRFIDNDTLKDIITAEKLEDLNLGIVSFIGIDIDGYELITESPVVINLTGSSPEETIVFKYRKL